MGAQLSTLVNGMAQAQRPPGAVGTAPAAVAAASGAGAPAVGGVAVGVAAPAGVAPSTAAPTSTGEATTNTALTTAGGTAVGVAGGAAAAYRPPLSKEPPSVLTEKFKALLRRCPEGKTPVQIVDDFKAIAVRQKQPLTSHAMLWVVVAVVLFVVVGVAAWLYYRRSSAAKAKALDEEVDSRRRRKSSKAGSVRRSSRRSPTARVREDIQQKAVATDAPTVVEGAKEAVEAAV
jgi:hypothetical protein